MSQELRIFLLSPSAKEIISTAEDIGLKAKWVSGVSKSDLISAFEYQMFDLLLSFGSSTIVPECILKTEGLMSINIHAASPQYPGRDPHHFAVYENSRFYGATMHFMTERVDEGEIIDVSIFEVNKDMSPAELLCEANKKGMDLVRKLFLNLSNNKRVFPQVALHWNEKKRTRKDFEELCKIGLNINEKELKKRIDAFHVKGYNNLYVELHGCRFYLDNE